MWHALITGVLMIIGCALIITGGYFAHLKITENESQFIHYRLYTECVEKFDKTQCTYILDKVRK